METNITVGTPVFSYMTKMKGHITETFQTTRCPFCEGLHMHCKVLWEFYQLNAELCSKVLRPNGDGTYHLDWNYRKE